MSEHDTVLASVVGLEEEGEVIGHSRPATRDKPTAIEVVTNILNQAATEVGGRAHTYDKPDGEESMPKVVALFNLLYGKDLTVEQGWMMMVLLKAVRSCQGGLKVDNYVDLAAYAAFAGKAAMDERQ